MKSTETSSIADKRFVRPQRGRIVAGVCAGLSSYLGVRVGYIRLAFVAASFALGFGVLLYLLLAFFAPAVPFSEGTGFHRGGSGWDGSGRGGSARNGFGSNDLPPSRADLLVRKLWDARTSSSWRLGAAAFGLIAAGIFIAVAQTPFLNGRANFLIPILVVCVGILLSWWQLSRYVGLGSGARAGSGVGTGTGLGSGAQSAREPSMWRFVIQAAAGVLIAAGGALMLVLQGLTVSDMIRAALAAVAVLVGAALVIAPWWLRLWNELVVAREERAREANRAEMAAHIHDSVLQTLALIRTNAGDSAQVAQLARAQERELREWLYQGTSSSQASLAQELRELAAHIEDTRRTGTGEPAVLDVVCVGDRQPDAITEVLVQAAREAMINAVAHGAAPFSVYLEVTDTTIDIYVTDRGEGFDMASIPPDRFGVRQSIIGRMERGGGSAKIRALPAGGTEVHLYMPIG